MFSLSFSHFGEEKRINIIYSHIDKILCFTMNTCISARTRTEIINVFTCILDLCIYFAVKCGNRHVNENITFVYYIMRLYAVCCDAGAADIYR